MPPGLYIYKYIYNAHNSLAQRPESETRVAVKGKGTVHVNVEKTDRFFMRSLKRSKVLEVSLLLSLGIPYKSCRVAEDISLPNCDAVEGRASKFWSPE